MKYRVLVPPPKAKRMENFGKLVVILDMGWEGDERIERPIERLGLVEFEVPDKFIWIYDSSVIDGGDTFKIQAEYTNKNGERKQVIGLVPEKVYDN